MKMTQWILILLIAVWTVLIPAQVDGQEALGQLSVSRYPINGYFDYSLFYENGQPESRIHAPQRQDMNVVDYRIPLSRKYKFHLAYGVTQDRDKGTGDDSDWKSGVPDSLWYYGNMDFHGTQQQWQLDIERTLTQSPVQTTSLVAGYRLYQSNNELRNVNYHIVDSQSVNNETQADNGSTLDAMFEGVHIGVHHTHQLTARLWFDGELGVAALKADAVGVWNNHNPAWMWKDSGWATGYEANAALHAAISRNVSAQIGYRYFYARSRHASEHLDEGNGSVYDINGQVGLDYRQQGVYYGVQAKF